jgi:hypothetical protein
MMKQNEAIAAANNITINMDGWSNTRMESWYGCNIITSARKVYVIALDDLSAESHTGDFLEGEQVPVFYTV